MANEKMYAAQALDGRMLSRYHGPRTAIRAARLLQCWGLRVRLSWVYAFLTLNFALFATACGFEPASADTREPATVVQSDAECPAHYFETCYGPRVSSSFASNEGGVWWHRCMSDTGSYAECWVAIQVTRG